MNDGTTRLRPRPGGTVSRLLALTLLTVATPAVAQEGPPATPATGEKPPASVGEKGDEPRLAVRPPTEGLLRTSDLAYGGLFFGLLASVEPLAPVEEALYDPGAPPADGPLVSTATWAGNLWVDLGLTTTLWAGGALVGADGVSEFGMRSVQALVAADALATLFKFGLGRQRPDAGGEPDVFRPGQWNHDYFSFPSGHTAHVFALASVLDGTTDAAWVPWLVYPTAAAVGASRIVKKKHWPTDVIAGAAVGVFAGELVSRIHGEGEAGDAGTSPRLEVAPGRHGTVLVGLAIPTR